MTGPLNPDILAVARQSRAKSQTDVAEFAGVTQGLISKAERGLVGLSDAVVDRVATFLEYPTELFYEPGRIRETGSICLYHRKRKTLPAKMLELLDARMYVRNLNVRLLLTDIEIEGDRAFHTLDLDEYGDSPERIAQVLRQAWRVPPGPITNLVALLESAGAVVLMTPFGTNKLFGMSCWTSRGHPFFFLNADTPTEELRWTLAHELGHLTMHSTAPTGDPEAQADAFAGEFLMPRSEAIGSLRRLDFSALERLKSYWGISMKGIITRAQKLGAIDPMTSTRLYKKYSARRWNNAEPYPLPPEAPTLIREAVRVHFQDHEYDVDELAKSVRLLPEEFTDDFAPGMRPRKEGNVIRLPSATSAS